jgi:uncharacterized protein (DUF433 family)
VRSYQAIVLAVGDFLPVEKHLPDTWHFGIDYTKIIEIRRKAMSLEVSPDIESMIREEAEREGLSVDNLLLRAIAPRRGVEYRDTPLGRQPYMKGSGLAVWEVVMLARPRGMSAERIAQDYPYPVEHIQAALAYYEANRDEIDQAIEENQIGFDAMKRLLPNVRQFIVPLPDIRHFG